MNHNPIFLVLVVIIWVIVTPGISYLAAKSAPRLTTTHQHIKRTLLISIVACLFIVVLFYLFDEPKDEKWVAIGCPVYKSECGIKYRYSCEKRTAVAGRHLVGDIAVMAYKTC